MSPLDDIPTIGDAVDEVLTRVLGKEFAELQEWYRQWLLAAYDLFLESPGTNGETEGESYERSLKLCEQAEREYKRRLQELIEKRLTAGTKDAR